ncbi:uncharacterized protein BJX67DRAFT_200395 [Aspergillus lucknowensis]|uniref:RGS domain-containing protein n=1 Tax=Aspergillus lucknowensis TaxID=176173 RepID=A0ABR4LJY0_9EURO
MGSELGLTADSKPQADYSPISIWWAVWGSFWTVAVALGMAYLIKRRDTPLLRIRSLGLSLSAIALLHLYFTAVQFGSMYGALMPGDAQYWIMGTYLPCGMALFHGSNSYFLHVAKLQKRFAPYETRRVDPAAYSKRKPGLISLFRRLDYTTRVVVLVVIAMAIQIFLTVLMWVISRKFHRSWGIPGTEVYGSEMAQKTEQGRGWEWWPGVFSQVFWAWIVAPIILWRSRNIHDTQGWRVQTIACAIAGLPGTPMWLIALYVPGMEPVNKYLIPPQWLCFSILAIEICTVFIPCWEVMRHQSLRQETLDAIAQWEKRTKGNNADDKSLGSTATMVDSMLSGWKSTNGSVKTNSSARESILNMSALEYVLDRNPTPLQKFSALNDFSGENVAFLTSVTEWKAVIPPALRGVTEKDDSSKESIRACFNQALFIYAEFISVHHAEFPVNISSHDLKKLDSIFEEPARILFGNGGSADTDPATPFNKSTFDFDARPSPIYSEFSQSSVSAIKERAQYWGEVPAAFDATVFDDAEKSIKYLVLTNTWPKFIRSQRRISVDSAETLRSTTELV